MRRFFFGTLAVLTLCASAASAQTIYWKTVSLPWNGGSLTKSFTASIADTGFVSIPDDVAWNCVGTAAQAQTAIRIQFYCPTAAANADTVHYAIQPAFTVGSSLVYPFIDTRNQTAAVTNAATIGREADFGLVFTGQIQFNSTGITKELHFALPRGSRIKVQGDPNGALANLRCQMTYPSYKPN